MFNNLHKYNSIIYDKLLKYDASTSDLILIIA